jgi:hypothetical protein
MCRIYTWIWLERKLASISTPRSRPSNGPTVSLILDISRTRLIIDALEDELETIVNDEEFRRRLSDVYYDGRVEYDRVEAILGREEAMRMKLLRASIDRTPAIPQLEADLPRDDAFYDGEISEWTGSNSSESDDESHA